MKKTEIAKMIEDFQDGITVVMEKTKDEEIKSDLSGVLANMTRKITSVRRKKN